MDVKDGQLAESFSRELKFFVNIAKKTKALRLPHNTYVVLIRLLVTLQEKERRKRAPLRFCERFAMKLGWLVPASC